MLNPDEAAKHGCYPYMKTLGFDWPEELECETMPERGENELCLDFNLPQRVLPTQTTTFVAASPFKGIRSLFALSIQAPNLQLKSKTADF